MANRKATENFILKYIEKIAPGGANKKLYADLFASLDDKAFDKFMSNLEKGNITLSVIVPNKSNIKLNVKNNIAIGKELGYEFEQLVYFGPKGDIPKYKSPIKYLVYDLPVRRAAQLLVKKISIPEDASSIDLMSGQVTGKSKGSKITFPELQLLVGIGLNKTIKELLSIRGGDQGALNAMDALIDRYGSASQEVIEQYATGVESTATLKTYLNAAHLRSTL